MPGGSHFNTWGLVGGLPPLGGLTINNSVTIPRSHNFSDGESDSGTARTGNQVGATHFSHASRSRAHDSGVLASDHFNDTPYVPPRNDQSLPQTYSTHTTRTHGIPSYPSPAESHLSVESSWSSSSSSDQDQSYTSHSHYQQYNQPLSRQTPSNEQQHLQQHLQQPHSHYPAYHGLHRLGLEHVEYPPASATNIHYRSPARSSYQSTILAPEFFEHMNHDVPLPAHSSQTHIEQSSVSPSSSHGSLSTFPAAPATDERSRHLLFEDAGPYLRETLRIPPYKEVNLSALPDPPEGEKPNQPYPILIKLAIYGSPNKQLTLQEIYAALEDRFQWFKVRRNEKAWKNSIRHNLSLNKVFKNVPRAITEPGKGSYWQLDCSGGEGYKRPRKRRSKSARAAALEQGDDDDSSSEGEMQGTTAPLTGVSTGSNHPSNHPSPAASDDSYIDPELRHGSHIVGEGRTRSASRRPATTSPYPVPGPQHSPRYLQNQLPPHGSLEPSPRFGQPSFGQGGFGRPGFSQIPAARVPLTSTSSSTAFAASSPATFGSVPGTSTRPQHAFVTQDRNSSIIEPAPRTGIEYIHEGGLPSARRVQGYHQGQYQSSQGLSSSQQSDSSYPPDPKGKGRM